MTPRLLFLTERFPPDIGGVATSAGRIVRALGAMGLAVDVMVWTRYLQPGELQQPQSHLAASHPSNDRPLDNYSSNEEKVRLFRMGMYRHWDMTLQRTLTVLNWLHAQHPYIAVWGHYLNPAGFLAVWFGQGSNVPSVVSARGNDVDRGVFPPGDFARLQWTLERATAIASVSHDLARKIQLICDRRDVIVTKNSVDSQVFAPTLLEGDRHRLRHQLDIAPNEVVLGFCGELREKKGQQFLLQALSTVRQVRPACLLIVGDVRRTRSDILASFATTHPEDAARVIVTGHLTEPPEIARHLQLFDVFLLPSLWDGLPNALLEAMACQCCCIASDAGEHPRALTPGREGFLLPTAQLHRLGEAVLECLQLPPEERQRVGAAARDRVLSEFSLQAERQRLQAVLDKLGISSR